MIENSAYNKLEILKLHMLVNSYQVGALFCLLPSQENNEINDIEIKDYKLYFNSDYIENENFENMIINIGIKTIQFFFECEYDEAYCFVIYAFMHNYNWLYHKQYLLITYDKNLDILAQKLHFINIKKSSIIYYIEQRQKFMNYINNNFNNTIHNLSHINITNYLINNININSLTERCQLAFYIPNFNSINDMNVFFQKNIHNFSQFILFLFIMRYNMNQSIFIKFVRYYPAFQILNIYNNIYFHSNSFQAKELKNQINKYFINFTLSQKDWYL